MNLYLSGTYLQGLTETCKCVKNIKKLKNCSVLITGAAGLIGSYLTDVLLAYNQRVNANISIYALGLSNAKMQERFKGFKTDKLIFIEHNVNDLPKFDFRADYVIHAASNAFPAVINSDPVGTIMSNILGTKYLLDYAQTHGTKRLLYISSGEVYGQGDLNLAEFTEDYSGYVNPIQSRSCYPNGKRTAETLCVSYTQQFGLETVIVRPSHTYGPNATSADNRANVQFVNDALAGRDIVMNSAGTQMRSYTYISDCVSGILTVLLNGKSAEAYNIANKNAKITIAGFAQEVAKQTSGKVVFVEPDKVALAQRTPIEKQVLSSVKLEGLGWLGRFNVEQGIANMLQVLNEVKQ